MQNFDPSVQFINTSRAQISIARVVLMECGTYNPMYSRPYQTHMDAATVNNIVSKAEQYGDGRMNGAVFSGLAANIFSPSATPHGEIPIFMGWSERRIRFFMEVHVRNSRGSEYIYYFQGFTSHLGITPSGSVDPQMQFCINSFVRVNRHQQHTAYGLQVNDVVTQSAQIINGQIISQQMNTPEIYGLRPGDVFNGMQSTYLEHTYESMGQGGLQDYRRSMGREAKASNRTNNLPANYLAKIIDSYNVAKNNIDLRQEEKDLISQARGYVEESLPNENDFIRAISQIKGSTNGTLFTFPDLIKIDSNVNAVTNYIHLGSTQAAGLHQAGQTEYWNGSNRETLSATILSNAVPAVMMELMISKLYFRSTNHDAMGQVNTLIADAKSLTNMDISQNLEHFKRRFEKEIMFDMTYGNSELYALEMYCDMFGDTKISISVNNGPMITYTTPSFCDGLLAPVFTSSKENYHSVIQDLNGLINQLPSGSSSFSQTFNSMI